MKNVLRRTKRKLIPEGIYNAALVDYKIEASKFDQDKQSITLRFKTDYSEYPGEAGAKILKSCTYTLHQDGAFSPIVEALLAKKITDEEEIDMDSLVGKQCRLRVENKVGVNSGHLSSRVAEVFPLQSSPGEQGGLDPKKIPF